MKKISETITFFGSGPVAAKSLELLKVDFPIEAVITKPQPAHHKAPFPVLEVANQHGLSVFTPNSKQELSDLFATHPVTSRLGIVIDYGFIINQDVIDYFPLGIINSHFSLLPEWRGADPITFSILSGQKKTGISLMQITASLDEGPLLAQAPYDIPATITTPELTDELITLSHSTIKEVLPKYLAEEIQPTPQDNITFSGSTSLSYSRKLTKADGKIDWQKPAVQIEREIRAFKEWPKSYTKLGSIDIVVTKATITNITGQPGKLQVENNEIIVFCGEDSLKLERLIPSGKPEMSAQAFLAGYRMRLAT